MKKNVITLIIILLSTLSAQARFELPLWNDDEGDKAEARLYVYLAPNPTGQAILCLPGGAYFSIAIDNEGHDFAPWFTNNGISLIVLKYRLPNERHAIPLTDAEEAMRVIRKHAKEWNINPYDVGVMGSSAGGHLASTLATHYSSKETRPDFQVLLYPVITFDKSYTEMTTHNKLIGPNGSAELEELYSNEKHVTKDTPRAFIVLSAGDKGVKVENSLAYAKALAENDVPVSLHMYPNGYHGFGFNNTGNFKDADIWHEEFLHWLKTNGQ